MELLMVLCIGVPLPELQIGEWSFLLWLFVLVVGQVSWGFLIFFLFKPFECAGGFLPESKIREVLVLGRRDSKRSGDEDVLILEVLLAAHSWNDNMVG